MRQSEARASRQSRASASKSRWLALALILLQGCKAAPPATDRAVTLPPDAGPVDAPPSSENASLVLSTPAENAVLVTGRAVRLAGRTSCLRARVRFVADGKFEFAVLDNVDGDFSVEHIFSNPGPNRLIEVTVSGDRGCIGSVARRITVQAQLGLTTEARSDVNGCKYDLQRVNVPLADETLGVAVVGDATPRTIGATAATYAANKAQALINGGYFAFGAGPVSYAKGHLGYESPSGNVKGPRACLVVDGAPRRARIEQSLGREGAGGGWGKSLFADVGDVLCAGPQLVAQGANVAAAQIKAESFEASGLNQDAPYPRSAVCILDDGSLLLVVAQSATTKSCGLSLPALADVLIQRGCREALNLDGGGSSALWWAGPPVLYHQGTEDRAVYNGLLVYRR